MRGSRASAALIALAMIGVLVATSVAELTGRQERFGVLLLPRLAAAIGLGGALAIMLRGHLVGATEEASGTWATALIPPVAGIGHILAARWVGPVVATLAIVPVLAVLGGAGRPRTVITTTLVTVLVVVVLFLGIMGTWFPSDVRLF